MTDLQPPLNRVRAIGVHLGEVSPEEARKRFPGVTHTRPFISKKPTRYLDDPDNDNLPGRVERVCQPSWDAGLVPVYSFKLKPAQVARGEWDHQIRALADWHIGNHAAQAVLWHEPENDFSGADYAGYFNHIADTFRSRNKEIPLIYAAMAYQWAPTGSGRSLKGNTDDPTAWNAVRADLRCCDVYSGGSFPLDLTLENHPGFQRWLTLMAPEGRYGIAERGFTIGDPETRDEAHARAQVRARTIERERTWLNDTEDGRRCAMYLYWNSPGSGKDRGLLVEDNAGLAAIQKVVTAQSPSVLSAAVGGGSGS